MSQGIAITVDPVNLNQDINARSNIEQPNYVLSGQGWEEVSHNIDFVIKIADCVVLSQEKPKSQLGGAASGNLSTNTVITINN